MTPAEARLLDIVEEKGEAWIVPAQHRMARRLIRKGLLSAIPKTTRYNPMRGTVERRVTKAKGAECQSTES